MSRTNPIYRRAEKLLSEAGRWMTTDDLVAAIGCTRKSLRPAMVVLLDAGKVLHVIERERACYCIASWNPPVLDVDAIAPKKSGPPPRTWTLDYVRARCKEVGDCWLWAQAVQSKGYPQASIEGKTGQSVRSYVFTRLMGKRGASRRMCVTSRCGNVLCVSPECLVLKPRSAILSSQWKDGHRRATASPKFLQRKLTQEQVDELRSLPEGFNQSEWARRNGVHARTVCNVVSGKNYRPKPATSVFEWRP
jgi:hypothetical protein